MCVAHAHPACCIKHGKGSMWHVDTVCAFAMRLNDQSGHERRSHKRQRCRKCAGVITCFCRMLRECGTVQRTWLSSLNVTDSDVLLALFPDIDDRPSTLPLQEELVAALTRMDKAEAKDLSLWHDRKAAKDDWNEKVQKIPPGERNKMVAAAKCKAEVVWSCDHERPKGCCVVKYGTYEFKVRPSKPHLPPSSLDAC